MSDASEQLHPMAPHHLPFYMPSADGTDVLMVVMGIFLIATVLGVGNIYLRLHSLPERMAHKAEKLQFELVAVLCLISLFTHIHLFWIIALFLALIDIPDFGTPLRRIAGSVAKIAGDAPDAPSNVATEAVGHARAVGDGEAAAPHAERQDAQLTDITTGKVRGHA